MHATFIVLKIWEDTLGKWFPAHWFGDGCRYIYCHLSNVFLVFRVIFIKKKSTKYGFSVPLEAKVIIWFAHFHGKCWKMADYLIYGTCTHLRNKIPHPRFEWQIAHVTWFQKKYDKVRCIVSVCLFVSRLEVLFDCLEWLFLAFVNFGRLNEMFDFENVFIQMAVIIMNNA